MSDLLLQGISDAVGFVAGALLGMVLTRLLGIDVFAPGYGSAGLVGIALCGLGGGLGVQVGRRVLLPFLRKHLGNDPS
jgi:hypothetical protein